MLGQEAKKCQIRLCQNVIRIKFKECKSKVGSFQKQYKILVWKMWGELKTNYNLSSCLLSLKLCLVTWIESWISGHDARMQSRGLQTCFFLYRCLMTPWHTQEAIVWEKSIKYTLNCFFSRKNGWSPLLWHLYWELFQKHNKWQQIHLSYDSWKSKSKIINHFTTPALLELHFSRVFSHSVLPSILPYANLLMKRKLVLLP